MAILKVGGVYLYELDETVEMVIVIPLHRFLENCCTTIYSVYCVVLV